MSDFTIDIELSLSKSEREAMVVLDRLERQIERLNKSIKIVATLDVSGIDSQVKVIQQKFARGKVSVGLPDDRAVAGLEAKMIASNKRIQEQVVKAQASARPAVAQATRTPVTRTQFSTPNQAAPTQPSTTNNITSTQSTSTQSQQPFPTSIELGSQSMASIRNLQNALIASIDRSAATISSASKESVLKNIASIAGGQILSSGVQNVVSNKALQQVALDKAQQLAGEENFQKASDALKGLIGNQPLLQKLKDSTMDFVASLRAIEGVEPIIQASQSAFKSMQGAIDRVKTEFASLSEKVGFTATIQDAYRLASKLTTETIERMAPVVDSVKAKITALDERFEISAKVQSLTDAATNAYALTLGVLVDKIKALDAQYRISEDALRDLSEAFEFSKKIASEFAEDVSDRITALKGVFNDVGNILSEEFATLLSESPKLLAAFTSLEGIASKIPFDKISAGFGAVKESFSELKTLVEQSFEFGFLVAFEKLDARVGVKDKIDSIADSISGSISDSIANFAKLTQAKGLEIKDALANFAIDKGVVSTYKNFVEEAGSIAKRLIEQLEGVKTSSGELRGVLGEVGDKYQGLSNLTGLAAKGLKVFDTNLQEIVPFLKQFDGAATSTVIGLSFLEQALDRLKNAALATQIADTKGLGVNVEIDPDLKALPSVLDLVRSGLKDLNGTLTIENLSESLLIAQYLEKELKLLPTPRPISIGDADLISALASITSTEVKLKQMSEVQSKINVNSSEIIDAEIVTERLLLAASKVKSSGQLLLSAESPDLDRIEKQIEALTSRELNTKPLTIDDSKLTAIQSQISALQISVLAVPEFENAIAAYKDLIALTQSVALSITADDRALLIARQGLTEVKALITLLNQTPLSIAPSGGDILDGEIVKLKSVKALTAGLSSSGEGLKIAPSVDENTFKSNIAKLEKYRSFNITVRAVPAFEAVEVAYAKLSNEIVDDKFKITAGFDTVIDLGRALKTIQSLVLSIGESRLTLTSTSDLRVDIAQLKEIRSILDAVKSSTGKGLQLSPSIDQTALKNDLSFYEDKTIEVRATPVFDEVYTAYRKLDETVVNLPFRIDAYPEFDTAFAQLKSLDTAIDGVRKDSTILLKADGLDGAVTAFQAVEDAVKGVVSAMDSAARLSNQSLSTLKSVVKVTPVGGDLRTKPPFIAQALIDKEKLAGQSLKRLKALAADLKIEPLGNKSTKAAYITAIEEFITAGGKIGDAWKRTESTFEDVAKKMRKTADETGSSMVDDMNHSAADTVAAAWRRTESTFDGVTRNMVNTGKVTAEELVKVFEASFKTIEAAISKLQEALSKVTSATAVIPASTTEDTSAIKAVVADVDKLIKASAGISTGVKDLSAAVSGGNVVAIGTAIASLADSASKLDADNIKGMGAALKNLGSAPAIKATMDDVGTLVGAATGIATGIATLSTAMHGGDMTAIAAALTSITAAAASLDVGKIKGMGATLKDLTTEGGGIEKLKDKLVALDGVAKENFADGWIQARAMFHASTEGIIEQAEHTSKSLTETLSTQAADLVAAAWVRTQKTFKAETGLMVSESKAAGKKLVDNLNHGAADVTGFAWIRTLKTFKSVVGDMISGAKGASGEIGNKFKQVEILSKNVVAEIKMAKMSAGDAIRVDADFSQAIDKTKAAVGEIQTSISAVKPPEFDDVLEGSTNGIRSMSDGFNGLIENVIAFKNNVPNFKVLGISAAGALAGIAALTGGILALVAAIKAAIGFAQEMFSKWVERSGQLVQAGQQIFEGWRNITEGLTQGARSTVEAWKTATSAIISSGQSILSTWQSVTSTIISGGKQLFDTWKGATDGVVGFSASSVKAYADVETSIKAVSGILDLSTKQSEELFLSVQKTGQEASNKFSTKQISALAATLAKGGKQVDEIKSLLSPIATGATAIGEEDLSRFGGNFLDVISKFGIPLKDSQKAVELYVKTLTSAKLDASNFANTIKYANVEKDGIEGLKDLSAQTIAFAQVGTRGSKVGTDVNRVMTELAIALEGTSEKAERQRDILKELGLAEEFAGDKAKDVVNRLPALTKAFNELEKSTGRDNAIAKFNVLLGTKGTQAILSFSKVSAEKFQQVRADLEKVANGSSGVVKKFAALATSGVSGAIVSLENNLETVQASLGKSLSKTVAGFATIATSILSTIGGPESPVFKALTAVGEKVEKLFSVGGKGEVLAGQLGKAFEGVATKGVNVFADQIGAIVEYFSDQKNINEFTKRIEYLGYVFIEVYKIATQLIGGFAQIAFQVVGAIQSFSQSSSGQALGTGINTAFTTIATGGGSLLEDKIKSIQAYFSNQTNVENFTTALNFLGKAALLVYSNLTDTIAAMGRMAIAAIGIVDIFAKSDVGVRFFGTLQNGFKDLQEQGIALTTKRLQEFTDHLQAGDNAQQFAAQLKSIGELSLFAYDGLTQAVAGLANIGLQAAKTTNDFIKSQEGVALIDRLSTTFKKVGAEANNLIQKGLGQVFEYLSKPEVSAAIENIALGFLKLYAGLTRIVGIGFDGLLKLGSALGAFFSSPKGQSTIDRLVEGFQKLMDVGISFLLEQLDRFTAWINEPGNLDSFIDLLAQAAKLWLDNYLFLTKFNIEVGVFVGKVTSSLSSMVSGFKGKALVDLQPTLDGLDSISEKLVGLKVYSTEAKRIEGEKNQGNNEFFKGASETFMVTIAPAVVNIKAAVDDFMKNGAPALGQVMASLGTSLGIVSQLLGNGIALVIRAVTAALPIINVILQPALGFINLIWGAVANGLSIATSAIGSVAGLLSTLLSGTLDPISKFIGGMFNGGVKNMGLLSTAIAAGFGGLEKLIAPVVEFIINSFYKLPENLFKIFGAITEIVQANWGAITKTTSDTVRGIGDGFKGAGNAIGGAFEGGARAASSFGESLKSGVIAKIEETKQFGADVGQGMAISWGEATRSMRANYDDFALNFGVTSQQTDQFFTDMKDGMIQGWNAYTNFLQSTWNAAVDAVTTKWNDYGAFFSSIADAIGMKWNEVVGAVGAVWSAAVDVMAGKWNEFASFVSAMWAATMSVLQPYLDGLVAGFNAAVGVMSAAWSSLTSFLVSAWNSVMSALVGAFQGAMNAVGGSAQNTGNALIGFFTGAANAIGSVFAQIGQGITAFFQPAVEAVNNIVEKLSQARSFGDGVGKVLSGQIFQGARADGGPVTGGAGAYLVGERGPEIFVPKTDGYIIPNHSIDGFRASGGPVTAGKTYVVGEIGTEAFIPGSGKKSASFTLDCTGAITPLLAQSVRAGDHLNTIALGIKNIQQNAYSIASQTKKGFAEVIAKIPVGGLSGGLGGFTLPNFGGLSGALPGFGLPTQQAGPQTLEDKIKSGLSLATPKVKASEGFRANAYDDGTGVMTIGYGETRADVVAKGTISESEAAKLMSDRLERDFLRPALALLSKDTRDKLTPGQIAAIASFAYNTGIGGFEKSSFGSSLIKGDIAGARQALPTSYINPGTNVEAGLRNRRQDELKLFNSTEGQVKGDGGKLTQLPNSFGSATGSTKVAGTLPKLSVSSLGIGSAQEYGASRDGGSRRHAGQDIDVFYTDPAEGKMYSMLGGIVIKNWEDPRDYFNYTDIYNPGQNLIERIAERGKSLVAEGQQVKPGQVVSKGVAGQASAIHYEIRKVEKDAGSKYGVKAVSPYLGAEEGTYNPIKKLEELGLGRRSGSDFIGSGQVLSSNSSGGGQASAGSSAVPLPSIMTYEQFAGQKGDGGKVFALPGSIAGSAAQSAAPPAVTLPTLSLPTTVSGKGGTKQVAAKIDPQKLKVALKDADVKALGELYDKAKGQASITAKLLPKTIRDIYGLSGTEEVQRDQIGALLINLRRLMGVGASPSGFDAKTASLGVSSTEFKKASDLATEAGSKGVEVPVELLGTDFKKAIGKTSGSIKAVELLKILSELKTADPTKYSSVSNEAIDRIAFIASLNDGERRTLDELVERLERDKRDRVVASELPEAVRKLLGVKSGEESVAVDQIKTLIKEIGELPISLPADLETALASLSEREVKNAIETIKDAQRAGDKAIFASSLTPELRKGLNLKSTTKIEVGKLAELLPVLEERLSKLAGSKEISRLEQLLKFNKVNLSSDVLSKFEEQYAKVIEQQAFDLKSLGQDEVNALEKLGVLRAGALGVGESYIDEAALKKLYGEGATIADAVNGTVKAVSDGNTAIVKAQDGVSNAVTTSTDKLPPVPVLTELQKPVITDLQKTVNPQLGNLVLNSLDSTINPSTKSIQDQIREIALKTGQDAFAIQNELQKQGLKAIGAVGGTGVLPTIAEIQSALKSSASFTQASSTSATISINDRVREIIERTGLDAFKIQDELQKQGLKAIGAVGGTGVLPTITEIRKILDKGLQKPVFKAAVSAGLPVANNIKPLPVKPLSLPKAQSVVETLLDSLDSTDPSTSAKPTAKPVPKAKSSPIIEAAKKVGNDAFGIQKELESQGLKAIGAVGGKSVLPTITEIQSALKNSAETDAIGSTSGSTLTDQIRDIAKRVNGDAFAIQKELENGGLRAIGAVSGKGELPTIAEIQKIVKEGNAKIRESVTASLPSTPPTITDSIASALGVDSKVFAGIDLRDPFAIQKALEKAGYKAVGALGADGKSVKSGGANELPTIDRIRKAVDEAMDANKGIVSAVASSTVATLETVQEQTENIELEISKLYGVEATGLTGLSGLALATEIQKRVQAKGGRAVGGLNSTKANELPTISEINSKLVALSKAIDTKQQSAPSLTVRTTETLGTIAGSTTTPAQKKFEFKFGGSGDTASREEVEGKLKQFEQYLNSDEFLAVAVEMVLSALKNDSRARLFGGLL